MRLLLSFVLLATVVLCEPIHGSHPPSIIYPDDIVENIDVLKVPYGRSKFLDPEVDLKINVKKGDFCVVTALPNAYEDLFGSLDKNSFPCDFEPHQIKYTHRGARSPNFDYLNLQIRYDTPTKTYIIPIRLLVEVDFIQRVVITRSMFLTVSQMNSYSQVIDNTVLGFTYNSSVESCQIATLSGTAGLPRYGHLSNDPSRGVSIPCEEFLDAEVRYKHTAETASPDSDEIPMVVELIDADRNILKQEYFQVLVKILNGEKNTPPEVEFSSQLMMEVNQFVMTAFTPEMLRATDTETNSDDIIFNITRSLLPGDGKIVSTENRNLEIRSFRQGDIKDYKIAYVPPAVGEKGVGVKEFAFQVIDSEGLLSKEYNFLIIVSKMNTLAPVATRLTGQLLYQGQSRELLSSQNLEISDEDNLNEVRIKSLHGPQHGNLLISTGKNYFTPADLNIGAVKYQHDGSETYSDNIVFTMTDGNSTVHFLFPIFIAAIDNRPPHIDTNTVLEVNEKETVLVTNLYLNSIDTYFLPENIHYVLLKEYSAEGGFYFINLDEEIKDDTWEKGPTGFLEKRVTEWSQQNIDNNELFYRHFGRHSTEVVMDVHGFYVEDGSDPPNRSLMNQFIVKVVPVDTISPSLVANVTLQMKVPEYQLTPFSRDLIAYTDGDTNDKELVYTITSSIKDLTTGSSSLIDTGKIVLYENPEEAVGSFTQAQIDHLKIAYQPPNTELGMIARMLQFTFSVSDESENIVDDQIFIIYLSPVDNKPPVVVNTGFVVNERGLLILSSEILDASDEDTNVSSISFTLISEPTHGRLQYDTTPIYLAGAFTRGDIRNGRILYQHLGSEETSDSFGLVVSDGMHKIPITVHITVQPIDDEQPLLAAPVDGILGFGIEVKELGSSLITSKVLKATDTDTNDLMLTFIVTKEPTKGQILLDGVSSNRFTQKDILNNLVMYAHTAGEIGTDADVDSFELTLSDLSDEWTYGGNRIERIELSVNILPVDSEQPVITMNEAFIVKEGSKATIQSSHLIASDKDTEDDKILCMITTQASEGFVENSSPAPGSELSRVGQPVSSFTIADIKAGNINYVQSVHSGSEPTEDRFAFMCQDGIPNLSDRHYFTIKIIPVNDEIPRLSYSSFVVEEGGKISLDLLKINGDDDDLPADKLLFSIVTPPKHGKFFQDSNENAPVEVDSFTIEQLKQSSVIYYKHDDSETTSDVFEIKLSDGEHSVTKEIPIKILPVDDETPRLSINIGLDVEINETLVIGSNVLEATDLDSDDDKLRYIITYTTQQGELRHINELGEEKILKAGDEFVQKDLDQKYIIYTHTGLEGIQDMFKFDVTDGKNPLIDRYFFFEIANMDESFPEVVNKGVTLKEGGKVTLTTEILSTADINNNDEDLTFRIKAAPARGHLESTDNPGLPITTFTQLELAGNKINYVHTGDDEVKMDSFEFEVTDGYNPVYRTFRISISDVDNKKPVVTISKVQVKEGSSKLITPFELKVDDRDTDDELLVIRITQIPMHGKIVKNKDKSVRKFTMVDLNENRISYKHDGSETTSDSFSLVVSDGTHDDFYVFPNTSFVTRDPQTMKIEIISVDNKIPQLVRNRAAPMLSILKDGRRGFKFTKNFLRVSDKDSETSSLTYLITRPTQHGDVVNFSPDFKGKPISYFTQDDINNMTIYYLLDESSNATSDKFVFSIIDDGENELSEQVFNLNWAVISLENATYKVNETEKYLQITLLRRGYLGETSFVTIATRNGSAKSDVDFVGKLSSQVQFNPGQSVATWKVRILQDENYEKEEHFFIDLSQPVMSILEEPKFARITITDQEDESTVFIPKKAYKIEEKHGKFMVPVHRSGDLSNELMVICYTASITATGTTSSTVGSFKDFISRAENHNSLIRFSQNESEKFCPVVIIDDSLYEPEEKFHVKLTSVMNGRLGNFSEVEVTIMPDTNDEPIFYFDKPSYEIDESAGQLEVLVWRTGTDLTQTASVTVQSRKSDPESATANSDYIGISKTLEFAPGIKEQSFYVTILDDLGNPFLEGAESFELLLRMPINGVLGEPEKVQVIINDSHSDLPVFQFSEAEVEVNEADGNVSIAIIRNGDLSQPATVRCYTRQSSAQVMMDFKERPNTNQSVIHFESGQSKANCTVSLEDDFIYEKPEKFRLVLGSPISESVGSSLLGKIKEILVTIKDDVDKPIIGFSKTIYNVLEPKTEDGVSKVRVSVKRSGDSSKESIIRLYTKDGNAESGKDYNPVSKQLTFLKGETDKVVEVEILHDKEREIRESFTVRLEDDENLVAEIKNDRAIIYINQKILADVTFPSNPTVISLRDYDDMATAPNHPPPGYPVICVSSCNPKHANYDKVSSICGSEEINDTATEFRWLVAAPSSDDGVTNPLKEVSQNTFFTDTNMITLDSIYFKQGSRISCVARAVNNDGEAGLESTSDPITVSKTEAVCQSRIPGSVGAEPFSAHIRYTGADDKNHQNLVKITVSMPHVDGMLPVISTRQLSNFEITLSRDGTRVGNHRCSNIINFDELKTKFGFLNNGTRDPNTIGETFRYQYDSNLRGSRTLQFYRNLKHEACMWEFTSYYDMTELIQECGGSVGTDGQVLDLVQSYVSLRIPLYVSYIYHSPVGTGWQHYDQQTELRMTFVYDTAILWDQGIGTPPEAELQGHLYLSSMRIREDGRLVVNFRTKARFHGLFVSEHPGTDVKAMVMSSSHSELTMTLNLVRSADTYNNPEQKWTFVSDYAIRDYSGTYTIKLIPCTTPAHVKFTPNVVCNPRDPLSFEIPIRFQQVSDPVAAHFSLNTNFYLLSKKSLYMSDGSMGFAEDSDAAFVEGAEIFGRVVVDPVHNLGSSFDASIEKVFVCSGHDGYVPKYDPENGEYGCLADTSTLRHQFKVLDKEQPDTQDVAADSVKFKAKLALDDPEAFSLRQQSGTDGFRMDSAPLFTVTAGREWYLHTIYTVRALDNQRIRRSIVHHALRPTNHHSLHKRESDQELSESIGEEHNRGTQMMHVKLVRKESKMRISGYGDEEDDLVSSDVGNKSSFNIILPVVLGVLVLIVGSSVAIFILRKSRQTDTEYIAGRKEKVEKYTSKNKPKEVKTSISSAGRTSSSGYSSSDGSEV